MQRLEAHRVWLWEQGVQSFSFALGWTVAAVFFVRELGMSPLELVLTGTALELAFFLFEIPTGVVADTYGRRLSTILGIGGLGLGFVVTGLASGVAPVLAAAAFMGFAWTFKSGAEEAWITDEVGPQNVGRSFQLGAQAGRLGSLFGIGAAVALALIDLRVPIVAGGVLLVVLAAALAVVMPETGFRSARRENVSALASMTGTARQGGGLIRRRPILLLIVGIGFFLGVSDEGFDRLWEAQFLVEVGVPGFAGLDQVVWFGVLAAGATLLSIVVAQPLARRFGALGPARMARALLVFDALRIVGLVGFAVAGSFALALAAFWAARLARSLAGPVHATWLNANIEDSRVRATVLSMTNVFESAGEWGGGPALGGIGNVFGIRAALAGSAVALLPVLGLYGRAIRHHGREPELVATRQVV
ncbi:MAG: MFS transporter [Actinobacteria bacterium]|nr:MFS transporter [Actinomycetota bacterium]